MQASLNAYMEKADELPARNEKAYKAVDFFSANGDTTRPVEIFGK